MHHGIHHIMTWRAMVTCRRYLPDPLEPKAVARFLKFAPQLDKEVVGEYLGDHKAGL
jgi:hypothetical protein